MVFHLHVGLLMDNMLISRVSLEFMTGGVESGAPGSTNLMSTTVLLSLSHFALEIPGIEASVGRLKRKLVSFYMLHLTMKAPHMRADGIALACTEGCL